MHDIISLFAQDDAGATTLEYGLIAGLIAVFMIQAVTAIGGELTDNFTNIGNIER